MEGLRICKGCLLSETDKKHEWYLEKYRKAIHPKDKINDISYQERLNKCKTCNQLLDSGTCQSCGCYVELRALLKTGTCPNHHWPLL